MVYAAPAKINLYLKVLRRMDDGYHEIETLFERISLSDHISIEPSQDETTITCDNPGVPTDEKSLMGRIVNIFKQRLGNNHNWHINLEKNIPIGAGLGGGSSDAATLLRGLNETTGFPFKKEELMQFARGLGADIPFFLSDASFAIGKGRGDIIEEVDSPLKISHILITPPFEISTKEVYAKSSDFGLTKANGVDRMVTAFLKENDGESLVKNLRNDLQAIVLRDFPELEKIFSSLEREGAKGSLLSGSGSTIFGIFDPKHIKEVKEKLKKTFPQDKSWRIFVAETC